VQELISLFFNRINYLRVVVTKISNTNTGCKIKILIAVNVFDYCPLCFLHKYRQHVGNTTGHMLITQFQQLL